MPELPEVETVVRQLRSKIIGAQIRYFSVLDARLRVSEQQRKWLHGMTINSLERWGKQIAVRLDGSPSKALFMLVHLRMTGRLIFSSVPVPAETKYLRAIFTLDRGWLVFQDTRRFGTITFCEALEECAGLDPLSRQFTAVALGKLLNGARTPIKPWLLRQDKLPGMGNIYASESLFLAGIRPTRPAGSLKKAEIERLRDSIQDVLRKSIRAGGTTFLDFRNGNGKTGNFARRLNAYDRAGEPCRQCGKLIVRLTQGQRSTFYCAKCQK